MKSRHRSTVTPKGASSAAAACLVLLVPLAAMAAAPEPARGVIYTASDFNRLAAGVDPGFSGEALFSVWAPATDVWRFEPGAGTINLKIEHKTGDSTPRWQPLGKIDLAKNHPLKLLISSKAPKTKDAQAPAPALLWISASQGATAPPSIDLVRGRLDSIEPSQDTRRTHSRTNNEGVDFQAPASAAAWRDRALHLREQMLVTLGLWPMFPKTPLNPRITGKLERGDYTIEKVVLETCAGVHIERQSLPPGESHRQDSRNALPPRSLV